MEGRVWKLPSSCYFPVRAPAQLCIGCGKFRRNLNTWVCEVYWCKLGRRVRWDSWVSFPALGGSRVLQLVEVGGTVNQDFWVLSELGELPATCAMVCAVITHEVVATGHFFLPGLPRCWKGHRLFVKQGGQFSEPLLCLHHRCSTRSVWWPPPHG